MVFCICKNQDADQLHGCAVTVQLISVFVFASDSTIPLLPKSEVASLYPSSEAVQPGLCRTWSETPKTGFLATRLIGCKALSNIFYFFATSFINYIIIYMSTHKDSIYHMTLKSCFILTPFLNKNAVNFYCLAL